MNFHEKVVDIQSSLVAQKGQFNKFGNYKYRSAEDIMESLKPLLKKNGLVLTIKTDMVEVGSRIYVKSTATLTDGTDFIVNTAFAREPEDQKGMSAPQVSGSASSYANKYCLGGLFLIDDTKDDDATNTHGKTAAAKPSKVPAKTASKPSTETKAPAKTGGSFRKNAAPKVETPAVGGDDDDL